MRFIDAHREDYGVEPICAVLPIAPSTYYEAKARERDVTRRSARTQRDATLMPAIRRVWDATRRRYGAKKVWKELLREGVRVARCGPVGRRVRAGSHSLTAGRARVGGGVSVTVAPVDGHVGGRRGRRRPTRDTGADAAVARAAGADRLTYA